MRYTSSPSSERNEEAFRRGRGPRFHYANLYSFVINTTFNSFCQGVTRRLAARAQGLLLPVGLDLSRIDPGVGGLDDFGQDIRNLRRGQPAREVLLEIAPAALSLHVDFLPVASGIAQHAGQFLGLRRLDDESA